MVCVICSVRDDREPFAGLARPGGFNGGVQCQHPGLRGDLLDDVRDSGDLLEATVQGGGGLVGAACPTHHDLGRGASHCDPLVGRDGRLPGRADLLDNVTQPFADHRAGVVAAVD
jgi:hypothetical protein